MQNPEERPAYVTFEYRPVEDRAASILSGHYVAKDVAFVTITRPGSRDSVERVADEWFIQLEADAKNQRIPAHWLEGYRAIFNAWKKGEELPPNGTPIKTWPALSPAQQKTIISAGILTIEDLASLSDSEISRLGTGGTSLKLKAQSWLDASKDQGKLAERYAALETKFQDLSNLAERLIAENKRLLASTQSQKEEK